MHTCLYGHDPFSRSQEGLESSVGAGHICVCGWHRYHSTLTVVGGLTDGSIGVFQVDKSVITAIAEGKGDPDARLLKVGNARLYT